MVALVKYYDNETAILHCGGSLAHKKFVVTAAHCVDSYTDTASISIVLGSSDIQNLNEPSRVDRKMKRITLHDKYLYPYAYYDVAVIELDFEVS